MCLPARLARKETGAPSSVSPGPQPSPTGQAQLGNLHRWEGEGVAGNGASLAPATSNPRLACEDNGCLIFSIRRAQCRILSFTRGGASEVISQRHSARTLLLCGGARTPASGGLAAGRGAQLRPLQRGRAGGRAGCGNPRCPPPPPRGHPAVAVPGRRGGDPPVLLGPPLPPPRPPLSPAARPELPQPLSPPITLPLSSGPQVLFFF